MLAAATIPYDPEEQDFTLQELQEHLAANLSIECSLTEWQGFDAAIPQVRVATAVPLTIQIEDDPDYVLDDIADLVDRAEGLLSAEWVNALRQCAAKLEVMEADDSEAEGAAEARLDPSQPDVEAVVIEIARFVGGLAYDSVNDEWLVPEG
jgi:hypothetical protein